ncbi:hypothetical protein D9M69_635000 [compost metagenome]
MHFGEQLDLMAGGKKHLKTTLGQRRGLVGRIAGTGQGAQQDAPAQLAEAMLERGFALQQLRANRPQVFDRHRAQAWRVHGQPVAQRRFGILHHRGHVPQGVVEVEGDQLNAHSLLPLRLARGWARSYTVARCWKSRWV